MEKGELVMVLLITHTLLFYLKYYIFEGDDGKMKDLIVLKASI